MYVPLASEVIRSGRWLLDGRRLRRDLAASLGPLSSDPALVPECLLSLGQPCPPLQAAPYGVSQTAEEGEGERE